ncbi:reverse transcriptase [Hamiltosporidium tvaerminnensis]|uniref:Reverse transcriptase n=1 Tax=Hamiltosporidium tvaerminnensis TaxID=1176355 RepID=A0A4Q9LPL6_9MICR|nr:reverse transcriptase [Hamiltosporidium tvaerminnensis]
MFELFRGRFYRGLSERVESEHVVYRDEISEFWSTMLNKNDDIVTSDDYLILFVSDNHPTTFPSLDEFVNIINWLPNWKAAGIDGIYNFFIKKLTTLHKYIYDIVKVICLKGTTQADWFYCGLTYLIPKEIPRRGSDYRPITCMSNLYKLTTKCVTKVVQIEVERRGLLSENQLGAVRGVQGAKEQDLLNIGINKEYGNNLKATWIDVKKAYESIDHAYLSQYIENLHLPDWILKFIKMIDRGILQGDSLSPLLFVLCMDPLSRKLNEKYTKVTIKTDTESQATNHLLFIDDLKLLAEDGQTLQEMTEEVIKFMNNIGFEINKEKLATTDPCCEDTATLFEGIGVYKYLGMLEDSRGIPKSKSFEELDDAVRAVLVKNKIYLRPGCKERLYIPRKEIGRGLHSKLEEAQIANLYNEIKNRKLHSKLYSARNNELVSVIDSSRWLKKGSVRPRDEAVFCYIQDRNVFWGADGMCQHCGKSGKTVDHLATRCEKMLGRDYTRRHNEVVRCIHLLLLNKYKFKSSKRIRSHSVQEILDNEYAEIRVDTRIKTDVKIRCNRPDIFILDKRQNKITLIEVGITSQDSLQIVETEKLRKYDLLANELGLIYKCSVDIIPYVMTWDGIVTKYHKTYVKRLQIPMNVEAYIQSIVLKKTVETISFDRRRGLESGLNAEESWERETLIDNEEGDVKTENTKNILPLILDGITTAKEPSTNTNEELELEEEIEVVEMCENDNVLKCLVETSGSNDENLSITTIPTLRKQKVSINDRERIIEKTLEGYSIKEGDRRSKLPLEIKESLQTYVDLECTKTLYELAEWVKCTFNVDVSTSTIDSALREFHYTLKLVTLVPERRNTLSTIEIRTNYATSFRESEVDNDDKNFVFLDEVGFAVVTRPSRGRNMRGESAYLSVTAARNRNILVVAAMNKYGLIYHKIHERAVNCEDFKLSIKEINESCQRQRILTPIFVMDNARIHHYRGLNDDEEIASYRIKYLPPYSSFLNPIENVFSVRKNKVIRSGVRTEPQLRILICRKFNEITGEHCSSFYRKMLGYLQKAEVGQMIHE